MAEQDSTTPPVEKSSQTKEASIDFNVDEINKLLAEEDPKFLASLEEVKTIGAETPDITLGEEALVETGLPTAEGPDQAESLKARLHFKFKKWKENVNFKALALGTLDSIKSLFRQMVRGLFAGWGWFKALPKNEKLKVLGIAIFAFSTIFLIFIFEKLVMRDVLGQVEVTSLESVADAVYRIGSDEKFEPFSSPVHGPDYVMLLPKLIIKLKETRQVDDGYAAFEVYLYMSGQDAAVEVKDRQKEFMDAIYRVGEELTWVELRTTKGKEKLKGLIRTQMNQALKTGYVREARFQNLIIKP